MPKYLLGIDVGTTGAKAVLVSADGGIVGQAYRPYPIDTPKIGWSEQNPEHWWEAVVETIRTLCADSAIGQQVAGISLSVQGGTMVAVDKDFQVVRPAMVWSDTRCQAEMAAYLAEVGEAETMYQKTGWELEPSMNAMQIRWMRDHEPELFEKTAMFLSVPDYIAYKMTGIPALDISNIGINQLGNIRAGTYDEDILGFAGISEGQLGKICRSGEVIGNLTEQAAEALGLTTKAVLSAGAHDQYAVALGAGACKAGDILVGSGTCWVITCIGDEADFASGLSQSVAAVPGKWGSLWSLSTGGICLEWLRRNVFLGQEEGQLSYERLNQEIATRKAAEDGLYFYPFTGRATLSQDLTRGAFMGLDLSHDRFHMARAVMEGVAYQIVWMLDAFQTKPSEMGLILAGGASKSEVWPQILADISGLPVRIPAVADLACIGAAILAGIGCGIYQDAFAGYQKLAVGERVITPDPDCVQMYARHRDAYQRMAGFLGETYHRESYGR